jgi:hypothetical protein
MKRSFVPIALVLVLGLGSYAIFGQQQQSPGQPQQGMMGGRMVQPGNGMQGGMGGGMMMQGNGTQGGMGRGMMMQQGGMPCPACAAMCGALMHESVTPTSDGGVVVSVAGKLIKYDSGLNKLKETNLDIDWAKVHQTAQQIMQNCPMNHRMMPQPQGRPQGQPRGQFQPQQ